VARSKIGRNDWSKVDAMREIQASDAKTHLPQILDEVERGETVVITRHGRPIARPVPETERRQAEIDEAVDSILAVRQRLKGKITLEEILSSIHEGHEH
jgi:prevent-host-death family protein